MPKTTNPLVLIIEDELAQMELAGYNLKQEGFRIARADDGEEGLLQAEELQPDLIVLDWMLPNVSGIEVCRRLKNQRHTRRIPIMMLTARGEEDDKVRGLETGADDFLVKPYSVRELVARSRALLRRTRPAGIGETISFSDLCLDAEQHKVTRGGQMLKLGPTEFRLLSTFMEKPGRVWTRDQLLDRVWGRDTDVDYRTVDVHIGRLRKVLSQAGQPSLIRTVRGVGYSLDLDS